MKRFRPLTLALSFALLGLIGAEPATQPDANEIKWVPYSAEVFAQAKKEHKLIILDLHAVWCHWCHVQDKETYANPKIQKLINENFLAIGVDQDSRPDISNRYEDWGWPATIIFNSDGQEIVKKQGFVEPDRMEAILKACIADPTVGPSAEVRPPVRAASAAELTPATKDNLIKAMGDYYDEANGAWGVGPFAQKFVDANLIEYSTLQATRGDKLAELRIQQTLTNALKIMDPAWGGVYQYSTNDDWVHPHFEKIMSYQTDDMRTYARSYAIWKNQNFLDAAEGIHHFLTTFLMSPEGAFYTSMDADRIQGEHGGEYFALDDAGRRKLGMPRIDTHSYARENGWVISALVALHEYAADPKALDEAKTAAAWVIANRSLEGGGFRHDEKDVAGPYLGDTLSMGRAFLDLYMATADPLWLKRANDAALYIEKNFVSTDPKLPGVATSIVQEGSPVPNGQEMDENVNVVRFARLLYQYTGVDTHQKLAEQAMKYLASPDVADSIRLGPGLLIADEVMSADPPHVVVVGSKSDPAAKALYTRVASWPVSYKRVEWYDAAEGPLMRMDVEYPTMPKAVVFVCANGACSSPISDEKKLAAKLASLAAKK
jgi:uncharacterized protein YyaL (SSP411 family)